LVEWIARRNESLPVTARLLPAAPLFRAVARALVQAPSLNGFYRDERFEPSPAVHLGVAISLRGAGLVAPAIHDAHRKSVDEIMAALTDLVRRARTGRMKSSELADPTVTVTSLGDQGVPLVFGVIFPPQTAIIGLGRITERPWVIGGQVVARPVLEATLSADHRVSDGHEGARFLTALDHLLQDPEQL
jgi:pyruvate dehydrogenase E2 component (dihydrolipoamide acetyltransferase)